MPQSINWWELPWGPPPLSKTQNHSTVRSTYYRMPHPNNKQNNINSIITERWFHKHHETHQITRWKWKLLSHVRLFVSPMDYTVHGILQAGILEWVAFPFSGVSSQPRDRTQVSHMAGWFFTNWTTAAAAAKSFQSCPTLCDPIDGSPPGSAVSGILPREAKITRCYQ